VPVTILAQAVGRGRPGVSTLRKGRDKRGVSGLAYNPATGVPNPEEMLDFMPRRVEHGADIPILGKVATSRFSI